MVGPWKRTKPEPRPASVTQIAARPRLVRLPPDLKAAQRLSESPAYNATLRSTGVVTVGGEAENPSPSALEPVSRAA